MKVAAVLVAALCAGCAGELPEPALPFSPAGPYSAPDPAELGPYPVGVRTTVYLDEWRPNPDTRKPRRLVTEIWYPATESAREGPFDSYVLFDELPADLQEGLSREALGTLETLAVRDAPPRSDGTRFPLVVFSHGKGGLRQQSTFLTVYLASHGYVVAAMDHEGDTVVELLQELKTNGDVEPAPVVEAMVHRPYDVSAIIDQFEVMAVDDPLSDIVDLEHVGVIGHSFGALTSFVSITKDSRIDVAVGQAPTSQQVIQLTAKYAMEDLDKPGLVQSAGLDRTLPEETNAAPLYAHLGGPKGWLQLTHGGHFTYSDLCILDVAQLDAALQIDASNVLTDGCGPENTDPAQAFPAIRTSAIGWFNRYLRDSPRSARWLTQDALDRFGSGLGSFQRD